MPFCAEDVEDAFAAITRTKWCVVVRPDRTVLHDGPLAEADRVLRESLALLAGGSNAAPL
jgi:3-(3-hydroxy-phenyl)propionate hydroxylase